MQANTFVFRFILFLLFTSSILSCQKDQKIRIYPNQLDYVGSPDSYSDREPSSFSDQGAWFSYSFPKDLANGPGFAGPFLMTQENGSWTSPCLAQIILQKNSTKESIDFSTFKYNNNSWSSHLEQSFSNEALTIRQSLVYKDDKSAWIRSELENNLDKKQTFYLSIKGSLFNPALYFEKDENKILLRSRINELDGRVNFALPFENIKVDSRSYQSEHIRIELQPQEKWSFLQSHTFFVDDRESHPYSNPENLSLSAFEKLLQDRKLEKTKELEKLELKAFSIAADSIMMLTQKCIATLQNNWRSASGELPYAGLFPSYHYQWFHGFWAWDSWKHAAALAKYNPELAKDQIRVMYTFMDDSGFIADCVYRDQLIESHNFRNTKPPLSAWACWQIYLNDRDMSFLDEMYAMILMQHDWWYAFRDADKDGLCEYGCTDGTLVAAKWESGMDNAVRFDSSSLIKTTENSYSLMQESVDLNAYLFAEKKYLAKIAGVLGYEKDKSVFENQIPVLGAKIQKQFYHEEDGWFYDTDLEGNRMIRHKACEAWITLWAGVASDLQAENMLKTMKDPAHFNTFVPLQTLSASDPGFYPNGGYWRGPNWIDQSYFAIKGLENYSFQEDADYFRSKILRNIEGVLETGKALRENYDPISGKGLEAKHFSWTAAHLLLLSLDD